LTVLSQGEEVAGTGVQKRIAGRSSRCEDDCIDDVRQDWDACSNDTDDPWAAGSPSTSTEQTIIIGRYNYTNCERSEHIKE
jgi:hypothetical protein